MTDQPPIDPKVSTISDEKVAALVSADIPCLTCEYNLRSLSIQGRCPECGQPVRDTLDRLLLLDQAATLNELVGFVNTMTVSLILLTIALAGYLLTSAIPFGLTWNIVLIAIAVTLVPFYWLTAMGGGIDIFRMTKRPAFRHNIVPLFMCIIALELTLLQPSPSLSFLIISLFFSIPISLVVGAPAWFAQHTKHLAILTGNAELRSFAKITVAICLVLPVLTLLILGWSATSSVTGQPWPISFQLSIGPIKVVLLTILLAMSTSSALLGLKLVTVSKKLRRTAQALSSQSSISMANPD